MMTEHHTAAGSLRLADAGRSVTLFGWAHKHRDFGELIFIDLRDRSGVTQIVVDQNRVEDPGVVESAKKIRSEYVLRVEGRVTARDEERRNPKIPTGDVEIVASSVEILSEAETPPFPIEEEITATEETRLRYRYLDLRRPSLAENLVLRARVAHQVRDYLHRHGFLEIETPILTRSTPEGARDFLVPSRVNRGNFYALPQSPQLFKQILMVAGMERYYQIAKCFRDEDLRSDRQPEFTQIDVEASFIDEEFIFTMIEAMFAEVFPIAGIGIEIPFPRMTWQEAMERFGIDRPDMRFGMELIDLRDAVAGIEFPPFQAVAGGAGAARGIVVPGGARFSRKRIDELAEVAKKFGAGGLVWVKFEDEGSSSIRKFLQPAHLDALRDAMKAETGDMALIVAGRESMVLDVLGNLRLHVAREEKMIPGEVWKFLWVVDFPLYEHDEETGRYFARHHPFTSPALSHLATFDSNPATAKARAYDIVLNGLELGGGSIRISNPETQSRMFRALGIGPEEARERFGFLLDAFQFGAPPHGGIALGLDRMIMLMARASSIRDVIAFPKTTTAQDLMTQAPSIVDQAQLAELGIALREGKSTS
ncbi:MAG TPA: aspartate--tRNA ligase [Thermoanaerobaculia bacterium]|nr:aspartate--tRNA ligase [Thermoanaerobaculia bacterium]